MPDTTAKIRTKGLANTGVTEEIARKLHDQPGMRLMAIVELQAVEVHDSLDGTARVDLVIDTIEPIVATADDLQATVDEHIRNVAASLHRNRMLAGGGGDPLPLDGDEPEPKISEVIAQGHGLFDQPDDEDAPEPDANDPNRVTMEWGDDEQPAVDNADAECEQAETDAILEDPEAMAAFEEAEAEKPARTLSAVQFTGTD